MARASGLTERAKEQLVVWRARGQCAGLNHPQLLESMLAEADADGYTPCDLNYAGLPNIYLRGQYGNYEDDPDFPNGVEHWMDDGFAMIVQAKGT